MIQSKYKFAVLLAVVMTINCGYANAEENFTQWLFNFNRAKEVKPVTNKTYKEECGSCHLAYQSGLLPGKSWEKLLTAEALHDHFGEVADLDKDTLQVLRDYALENSAEKSYYKRSRKITVSTDGMDAPLRITEVRYIKRKHHSIPEKMIKENKDVKSLSYCNNCHTQAEHGVYDNDTVSIPNYPGY